jgi:hypothetical protein
MARRERSTSNTKPDARLNVTDSQGVQDKEHDGCDVTQDAQHGFTPLAFMGQSVTFSF